MTILIGLDHGNGWVKAKTIDNQIVLPSAIARKDAMGESLTSSSKLQVDEYESNTAKGEAFVWGKDIYKAKSVLSTYGFQDRYKQKYYRLLNEFALAAVLGEGNVFDDVWVITGVPSEEKGTELENDLKEALKGTHLVKVNGEEKIIRVEKVIILPQPVGSVMSLYLDIEGFVLDDSYEESIGVIDIGTGTTDLDHIFELRRQKDDELSIPLGVYNVYEKIAEKIRKEKPNSKATAQKVEEQFKSDFYEVSKRAEKINIKEMKEVALIQIAEDIQNQIIQRWKTWDRFDKIIITGGGASSIGEKLKELIPDVEVLKNSQFANAEGFYRYGQMMKGE